MKIEYSKEWCMRMAQREEVESALEIAAEGKGAGLLGAYPMAAQVLADEVRRLRYQVAEWEKLGDPVTLHANLLRGIPCRLDRDTFLHLAGDETPNVRAKPASRAGSA